jgi:MFS family permease
MSSCRVVSLSALSPEVPRPDSAAVADPQDVYVTMLSVANCLGRLIAGVLSDMYRERFPTSQFMLLTAVIMAAGHFINIVADLNAMFISVFLVGISYGSFWALMPKLVKEVFGMRRFGSIYMAMGAAPAFSSYFMAKTVRALLPLFVLRVCPCDCGL